MVVLEGIVIFILAAYAFWSIGFPIILDIIWIKSKRLIIPRVVCTLKIEYHMDDQSFADSL